MGAYVAQYQTQSDGKRKEVPIQFMSQSFNSAQLKWEIPQKEAYSIFAALKKFDYLLRDRKFILRTDHKNITYLNTSPLSTIRKWKIYISEYEVREGRG